MRRSTATSVLLTAVLLATTLSGCTVSIVDPGAADAQRTPTPESTSSFDVERTEPTPPASSSTDSDRLSDERQADRDRLTAAASTTTACPTGAVTADGVVIRIEGSCPQLDVQADAAVVIADDVESLALSGSGTVVYVVNVSSVTVTGDASSVFWAGSTPSVDDTGAGNTVRKG
ncbi:DUF3060 domain-containing protein [Microbacterium sp. GCS4]|uniref:DUF3060 domain-containing protein n=1 Tax=Microbacterium sp. GCS4 TaxID=1692239 RepID=UPI000681C520|nr:DUF3060 domain-containing protein [Microbacterium sp. GCS4]KNY05698.1 hypothetical protein AKH00_07315 [Microbacterium sp. GCS4]